MFLSNMIPVPAQFWKANRTGFSKALHPLEFLIRCALLFLALVVVSRPAGTGIERDGLLVDLDADRGVHVEEGDRVHRWDNQVSDCEAERFLKRDRGRDQPGSGRPTLKGPVERLGGHRTVLFRRQELVNRKEDVFDHLITGSGYTWVTVLAPLPQNPGLKDVNSFFGNLRNGGNYEGIWAGFNDDNTLWAGTRNGKTFGRWDRNNPKITGPQLNTDQFYCIAARMGAGKETPRIDLFVNSVEPVNSGTVPINPDADASRLAIGQERDAVGHPGKESFDGRITRFLLYERPLNRAELKEVMKTLKSTYEIQQEQNGSDSGQ